MRVAVTGGTGYLGAHTVKTLLEAGHSVRLLVAPGCGDEPVIPRLRELGALEVLDGDIRDTAVVAALLDGCDSVLHAAGVVGTNDRQEKLMWDINAYATEAILTRAVAAGLDPVVSVSSYSALFPPPNGIIGPDSPTVPGRSAYARTKAYGERVARRLQDEGAPVVVTYPSSVVGPAFHTAPGVTERGWAPIVK
ncbi:MAG: NAD-dependent epimerase/dehydratase family protein, partial [Mycobacterium sp.]